MFRRILVPTDGTELCIVALDAALGLARLGGGTIVGLHAWPPPEPALLESGLDDPARLAWRETREQQGGDALAYVRRRCRDADVPCETVLIPDTPPHEAIERVARERGCDLIVLAAHTRRGLRARLLGSEAEKVLASGTVPLLIVR